MRVFSQFLTAFAVTLIVGSFAWAQADLSRVPQPPFGSAPLPEAPGGPESFSEGFEPGTPPATGLPNPAAPNGPPGLTANLPSGAWFIINKSEPLGLTGVFQGNAALTFPAQAGTPTSYAAMNFQSAGNTPGNQSVWLMTPEQSLQNGDTFSFWTRGPTASTFPDRLFVRMSTSGGSTDTGVGAAGVGVFTNQLLVINPNLTQGGYPTIWTQFNIVLAGLWWSDTGTPRV